MLDRALTEIQTVTCPKASSNQTIQLVIAVIIMAINGVYLSLRHNKSMDTYGNPGPYQDPKMREWWDALEVETQENND